MSIQIDGNAVIHGHRCLSQDFILPQNGSEMREDNTEGNTEGNAEGGISVVVACHSHAPLQEFWDRLTAVTTGAGVDEGKEGGTGITTGSEAMTAAAATRAASSCYCISLPCCGKNWSTLNQAPVKVYEDYEIFSPKRRVFIYSSS